MFKTMRELNENLFYFLSLKTGLHAEMLPPRTSLVTKSEAKGLAVDLLAGASEMGNTYPVCVGRPLLGSKIPDGPSKTCLSVAKSHCWQWTMSY